MKQKICIGVLNGNTGIEEMLNTIGVPWERCRNIQSGWMYNFSAIIYDGDPGSFKKQFEVYEESGGAVLDLINFKKQFTVNSKKIKQIKINVDDVLFGDLGDIDIYEKVLMHPKSLIANHTIWISSDNIHPYIFCGIPFAKLFTNSGTVQKEFPVKTNITAYEHVNRVSKQKLVHLLLRLLIRLHEIQNLPFVHKWWHPENFKTTFALRIDSDFAAKSDVIPLIRFLNEESLPNSWFLHVEAHEDWLNYFHRLKKGEVAVHGYRHKVYNSADQNKNNIREALIRLRSAGFYPEGFASPYGIWNDVTDTSSQEFNFSYSSEFSFAYDSLPLFTPKRSLQLPIHPVCIATLAKAGADEHEMIQYFSEISNRQIYFHDPVIFYHHPLDNHFDVWKSVFKHIKNKPGIKFMTFSEWAKWWRKRESANPKVLFEKDTLSLHLSGIYDTVYLAVHTGNNKFLITRAVQLSLKEAVTTTFYDPSYKIKQTENLVRVENPKKTELIKSEFLSKLWRW